MPLPPVVCFSVTSAWAGSARPSPRTTPTKMRFMISPPEPKFGQLYSPTPSERRRFCRTGQSGCTKRFASDCRSVRSLSGRPVLTSSSPPGAIDARTFGVRPRFRPQPAVRATTSEPMRLLVLGDFSGKSAAERPPLASRPTQRVDIDNLDDVMRRLRPRLTMPAGEIEFEQIDDFHPDRLYARLDLFQAPASSARQPAGGRRRSARPPVGQTRRARCGTRRRAGKRARRADPQHRRAAHRQGHFGADQAVSGGGGCRDRGADAHAAA